MLEKVTAVMDRRSESKTKLDRIDLAMEGKPTDTTPVLSLADAFVVNRMGYDLHDAWTKDPKLLIRAWDSYNKTFYADGAYATGNNVPLKVMESLGGSQSQLVGESLQIKGGSGEKMNEDEYDALIKDPYKFLVETILPRKFPAFTDNYTEASLLSSAATGIVSWLAYDKVCTAAIEANGLPIVCRGGTFLPPDMILDFLRDFVGTSKDLHRHPQELLDAMEALYPLTQKFVRVSGTTDGKHFMWIPQHLPTYLRPKQFEKFYWPFMTRFIRDMNAEGYRLLFFCENDWTPYVDYLKDLPEGPNGYIFERGDLVALREAIRGKGCFIGGMPLELLKRGTKEECVDYAKKTLDELGGPGYIFSTDKNILYTSDLQEENYAAVCEYVHIHGRM